MGDLAHSLRDKDIRHPLHSWLLGQHADDPTTRVIHELKLPRPSARVDLAVVNGRLEAFEIKSDVDSLARLPRQIRSYNRVFDRVCIVTTRKHAKAVRVSIPLWWGITIATARAERIEFRSIRKPRDNPQPDLLALLHALHIPELRLVLRFGGVTVRSSLSKSELIEEVLQLPAHLTRDASREVLKNRYPKMSSPSELLDKFT